MTMIDLYLKAGSKSAMTLALKAAGFSQDPESGALYHPAAALDVIGTIYQPTGETTLVDGQEVPVMAPVSGYHVNVRTTSEELAAALDAQRTYPVTPVRVWA
ncbi:hypothetical protein VCX44_21740 [Aeromonas caviae]|uniref:Uncharacterized protein n=1 Tax=Aeromonas caviae TaxID=648 RepID=A0ABU5WF57_AERCA|nr:hypothetical protein [Aeromonas caviae]MEA9438353.1 hypothetical protein [Aeromonas caviae]